jgi:hypothetical protein
MGAAVLRGQALRAPGGAHRRQPLFSVPSHVGSMGEGMMQLGDAFQGKNVPAVGKRSRAMRSVKMTSGIIAPVLTRANERCNAPRNLPPALAVCRCTPAPRRRNEAKKRQCGCCAWPTDEHLTATAPADHSPAASLCSTWHTPVVFQASRVPKTLPIHNSFSFLWKQQTHARSHAPPDACPIIG